jgi:hypothetical protein
LIRRDQSRSVRWRRHRRGIWLPMAAGLVAFAGGVVAIVGTYWDDAWHTDRGRDSFLIAPHLTLYGGVLVAGVVALGWAARRWAASGARGVVTDPPLALALAGPAGTLVSAPIDDARHRLFGRDAVLRAALGGQWPLAHRCWSPPCWWILPPSGSGRRGGGRWW